MPKQGRTIKSDVSDVDYRALAEFRYQIRRFLRLSERAARQAGMEPQQHQLLLTIKGLPSDRTATVGEIAERLQIQHHSAVELINRSEEKGVIRRTYNQSDRRLVVVELTAKGERLLRALSVYHRTALRSFAPGLVEALEGLAAGLQSARSSRRSGKKKLVAGTRAASSEASVS